MSPGAVLHAINTRASTMLAVSWKRVWKEAENGFYFRLPSFPNDESRYQVAGGNRVCSTLQCWSTMSSGGVKFYFAKLFPPVSCAEFGQSWSWISESGPIMSACLCQIVYTWLHMRVGRRWRVADLHSGVCTSVCVCVSVCPISLPGRLFQNTLLIKVGQVCDWTLFLSESNFRVLPISGPRCLRQWLRGEESLSPLPLTSAGPLEKSLAVHCTDSGLVLFLVL